MKEINQYYSDDSVVISVNVVSKGEGVKLVDVDFVKMVMERIGIDKKSVDSGVGDGSCGKFDGEKYVREHGHGRESDGEPVEKREEDVYRMIRDAFESGNYEDLDNIVYNLIKG